MPNKKTILLVVFLFFSLIFLGILTQPARGVVSSCSASVTPTTVAINTSTTLTFSITNSDTVSFIWVKITSPSANFTIESASSGGWSASTSSSEATFISGNLPVGGGQSFSINIATGSTEAAAAGWTVQVSDNGGGTSPFSCSGNTSVAITAEGADTTPPNISDITISDIADTSAKISWTTDENTTGVVSYGTTDSYGSSASSSTSTTLHSVSLSSLSANTTYHYKITFTDSAGNSDETEDYTFTTAKAGTTTTTTIIVTPAPTADATVPRVVVIDTDFSKVYAKAPKISGEAFDSGGVAKVEYSLDGGKSWFNVPAVKDLGGTTVSFNLTPANLSTGSYSFLFQATDKTGNKAVSVKNTLVIDLTPPKIILATDFSKPFLVSPEISGETSDTSGIETVEYSVDDGVNWLPIENLGAGEKGKVLFSFNPNLKEDGNYPVKIRVKDLVGNQGISAPAVLIIDRLPPQVGTALYAIGPYVLTPNASGQIVVISEVEVKVTLSAVGGPTTIELVAEDLKWPLTKNSNNGLWSGTLKFPKPGVYKISANSIDGANNKTERLLLPFLVVPSGIVMEEGKPIAGAEILIYELDTLLGLFRKWDGQPYGQNNPQKTENEGGYGFLLPAGTYYLEVRAKGFTTVRTNIFNLTGPSPITSNFSLKKRGGGILGWFFSFLPELPWTYQLAEIPIIEQKTRVTDNPLTGQKLPELEGKLNNIRGKPTIVIFLSTWAPGVSEQMEALKEIAQNPAFNVLTIIPQESDSRVALFAKRGQYPIPVIADPDGKLVPVFNVQFSPQHVFVDQKGVVKSVFMGLLNKQQLLDNITN